MNSIQLIKIGEKILKNIFNINPEIESELILSNILNTTRERLIINPEKNLNKSIQKKFNSDIKKRKLKKPIAYILGYKEFWNKKFIIDKSVLIPRPDTELIVEKVLEFFKIQETKNILDIGTGSGCILISLLVERKKFKGVGIDLSKNAIKIAKNNAKMQQLRNRIRFINTDVDKFLSGKYDIIVSNPPYIKKCKLSSLIEDVKCYEPLLALDGGPDGFLSILKVIKKSSKLLKKKGKLFLEIDNSQVIQTKKMLLKYNFFTNNVFKDLGGHNRCIVATKN